MPVNLQNCKMERQYPAYDSQHVDAPAGWQSTHMNTTPANFQPGSAIARCAWLLVLQRSLRGAHAGLLTNFWTAAGFQARCGNFHHSGETKARQGAPFLLERIHYDTLYLNLHLLHPDCSHRLEDMMKSSNGAYFGGAPQYVGYSQMMGSQNDVAFRKRHFESMGQEYMPQSTVICDCGVDRYACHGSTEQCGLTKHNAKKPRVLGC
jgi:hypothetical protein